jgi:hypothetical protein
MHASHILIVLSGSPRSSPDNEKSEHLDWNYITLHKTLDHNIDNDVFYEKEDEIFYHI